MIFKLVMVEKLGRLAIYNLILCLSCFFKQKHLADLENTNFMIKIRDFLKSLKNS